MWIKLLPALLLSAVEIAAGQTYTQVYAFTNGLDGSYPTNGVVADAAGNLYGTTAYGGVGFATYGTAFEVLATGGERSLHEFSGNTDGAYPHSGVIVDDAGNVYSTTQQGGDSGCQDFGCGVVFKISQKRAEQELFIFKDDSLDGGWPVGGITRDGAGNLYGTGLIGGSGGDGVIFRIDPSNHEKVLYNFSGSDGNGPNTRLVRDQAGNFYGATEFGGGVECNTVGCGVVYRLNRNGGLTVLYKFTGGADGGIPTNGALALDSAGNIYGTTTYGGDTSCQVGTWPGCGVVYKLDPAGNQTVLYSFHNGADGATPSSGVLLGANGNLYGTAQGGGSFSGSCARNNFGCGVIFQLSPAGEETILHTFQYDEGAFPQGDLIIRQGFLYGTAETGGANGFGVVYKIQP